MIGKLLGHNKVQTTARYAHLANDPVKAAANRDREPNRRGRGIGTGATGISAG